MQGSKLWIVIAAVLLVVICSCIFCGAAIIWLWNNGDRLLENSPYFGMLLTLV